MRNIFIILFVTLCSTICCAQGNDINANMLEKSREQFEKHDYDSALYYINKATLSKGKIQQDPSLAADIHEQYCMIFSALNDKQQSDYHRNMYLDIKEQARRDHSLEKEAEKLQKDAEREGMKIAVTFVVIIIILIITFYFIYRLNRRDDTDEIILNQREYSEMAEELMEQIAVLRHHITTNKEQNADMRTKVFLINTITPLIERMRHEIQKYMDDQQEERAEYIREILSQIQQYNDLLTEWIRLEKGHLSFKVETFPLEELFALVRRNRKTFAMKGVTLKVEELESLDHPILVKADKTLTLFMLNTLADNARKATPEGGTVSISAEEVADYVEISITDTGKGMTEEELSHVFSHTIKNGHGFGLQNCRGIINSYKKAGTLFNCCMIDAESTLGKGSRFFFRLAKSITLMLALLICSTAHPQQQASRYTEQIADMHLRQAAHFADSAYYCNMNGKYAKALHFADSVQLYLNEHIINNHQVDSLLMGEILVDISNEAAVAALALHRWEDYRTYNSTYEQCFNRLTNNQELENYCAEKEAEITYLLWIKWLCNVGAIIAFIIALLSITNKYIKRKKLLKYIESLQITEMKNTVAKLAYENDTLHIANNILTNGLSTIKHETLYFPSRIKQLFEARQSADAMELVSYYRELHTQLSTIFQQPNLTHNIRIEHINLHDICGTDIYIRGDRELFRYMLRLLKKHLKTKELDITIEHANGAPQNQYTDLIIHTNSDLPSTQSAAFTPDVANIPYLICRHIIRDMSGKNDAHGCGITIDAEQHAIILRCLSGKRSNN